MIFSPAKNELPNIPVDQWLTAKQIGAELFVDEDTVLRWWHQGLPTGKDIPPRFMLRHGFKEYLFHPAVLDFIRQEQSAAC